MLHALPRQLDKVIIVGDKYSALNCGPPQMGRVIVSKFAQIARRDRVDAPYLQLLGNGDMSAGVEIEFD